MNSEQFLEKILKEFNALHPGVEFTLVEETESRLYHFYANGKNLKIRWNKKFVDDILKYRNVDHTAELSSIYHEQLLIAMSALQKSK
jgi:hypothetical protein